MAHKPSKRDLVQSRQHLLDADRTYTLNSDGDFFYQDRYLWLNTTELAPEAAARQIAEHLGIPILSPTGPAA